MARSKLFAAVAACLLFGFSQVELFANVASAAGNLQIVTDPEQNTTAWTYDSVGNRLTQSVSRTGPEDGLTSYQYDANDRLQSHSGPEGLTSYSYDANGNTTTKTDPQGTTDYSYNQANRLTGATTPQATLEYAYHPDGIRREKIENGQATHYLIDPNQAYAQVLGEYDAVQNELAFYTYGDDLLAQSRGGQTSYYHYDGLGTTRALPDESGVFTDGYTYEAFGELTGSEGSTENNYLFTGEQFDPGLGLYYLRARYMAPEVGRLTQQDAWLGRSHEPITVHKYLYANGNPVHYTDPSGHMSLGSVVGGSLNLLTALSNIARVGVSVAQVYGRLDTTISVITAIQQIRTIVGGINVGTMVNEAVTNDNDFKKVIADSEYGLQVLSRNMANVVGELATSPKKQDQIEQFLKAPKNNLILYGPTPSKSTPWFPPGTHIPLATITLSKSNRSVVLELGKSKSQGGRFTGIGHTHGAKKSQGSQWSRMDWHGREGHNNESYDWEDGDFHFHTTTAP